MDIKSTGYEYIDKCANELHNLSKFMFENPELAYNEHKAHDYICSYLESKGFKVDRHFLLETGFKAVYETAAEPHLVLMVELDALPEIGHACGHNILAECSVAAGIGLLKIMKKHQLLGKLTLLGTPAEENGGGKITYVSAGFFKDVTAAMLSHPSREDFVHRVHLSVIEFKVTFKGKEAHAAVAPWEGINALDAAVMAYQSVSCLRQQVHPDCRIHGIITHGGDAPNIIPHLVQLKFEVRALTNLLLKELLPRVLLCFEGAAKATGCQVEISNTTKGYDNLLSNRCLSELFENNAKDLSIELKGDNGVSQGSSDVGNVSHACPTIQPGYYIGTTAEQHTKEFAIAAGSSEAQRYTLTQAKCMTGTLADILLDKTGDILKKLKLDFEIETKDD